MALQSPGVDFLRAAKGEGVDLVEVPLDDAHAGDLVHLDIGRKIAVIPAVAVVLGGSG